jgi:hypothetical protein
MTAVDLDEATAALPEIDGVTTLEPPRAAPHGQQAHAAWCIAAPDQATALDRIEAGLASAGWDVHAAASGANAARVAIAGARGPFRIQVAISAAPRPGCSPASQGWFAAVTLYEVAPIEPPPAP